METANLQDPGHYQDLGDRIWEAEKLSQIAGFIDCEQHSVMDFTVTSLFCLRELKLSGITDMDSSGRGGELWGTQLGAVV